MMHKMADEPYTLRRVASIDELIEKVLIWDNGFDDRVMELYKRVLSVSLGSRDSGRTAGIRRRGAGGVSEGGGRGSCGSSMASTARDPKTGSRRALAVG